MFYTFPVAGQCVYEMNQGTAEHRDLGTAAVGRDECRGGTSPWEHLSSFSLDCNPKH